MKLFSLTLISVVCCFLSSCIANEYVVMTITGLQSPPETVGIAYVGLIGTQFRSPVMRLNRMEKFKPGRANAFDVATKEDLGSIQQIKIVFGIPPGAVHKDTWFLEGVVVTDKKVPRPRYFVCNYRFTATQKKNATKMFNASPTPKSNYKVIVETGDQKEAGTHGKVYLTLLGSEFDSRKIRLNHEWTSEFQRGQTDTFDISAEDIGDVSKIRIELDSTADSHSPNWFLKAVSLVDEASKLEKWFPWYQWLTPTARHKKISVEIPVSSNK